MKGRKMIQKVHKYILMILAVLSILYYCLCVVYGGIFLSWLWIWPLFSAFCVLRFFMIGKWPALDAKWRKPVGILYYGAVAIGLGIFLWVESQVLTGMMDNEDIESPEYIIVLGAGVNGVNPTNPLRMRIEKAYQYMTEHPDTIVIASGGQGFGEDISEAECIRRELVSRGIAEERIILEERSTNTRENLEYSYALLPDENMRVGILTSGFHVYRATLIANSQGHENVVGIPARTLFPLGLHYIVREFFGVMKLILFS